MDVDELIRFHPQLFHLTEAGSWPSVAEHGLWPTHDIVTTSGLSEAAQADILTHPRPRTITVEHPRLGSVVIRDQTPLRSHILERVLIDVTERAWLTALNERVFFWLHPQRLNQLLNARRNRGRPHNVIVVDTASLVAAHHDRIRLSPINSGATLFPGAPERGTQTFQRIEDYRYAEQRRRRSPAAAVVELAVIGGVPDIADHVLSVHRRLAPDVTATSPVGVRGRKAVPRPGLAEQL